MRLVDHTAYPSGLEPTLGLRQVFGRFGTKRGLSLKAVRAGLTSVESFAILGDDLASAKTTLRTITAGDPLGADASASEVALLALAALWQTCHTYQSGMAQRRANLELDPTKIPEMSSDDHSSFRSRFLFKQTMRTSQTSTAMVTIWPRIGGW